LLVATGKGFLRVAAGVGDIFQAVLQIVCAQRGADLRRKGALLLVPFRRAVMLNA